MRKMIAADLLICAAIGFQSIWAAPKSLVALAPTPVVRAEIAHLGDTHHLALPLALDRGESVSLNRRRILGERLSDALSSRNIKNWTQAPPDYRFKPDMAPYAADQVFTIPTPLRIASF